MPSRMATAVTALGAVVAVCFGTGAPALSVVTPSSPWNQTDYNAAQSRANLAEKTLTAATVAKARFRRSITSPPGQQGCTPNTIVAPLLTGGRVYAVTNGRLAKYNAATGALIWRHQLSAGLDQTALFYRALSVANGLVVVGENSCDSASDPNGHVQAYSASTGARVWSKLITPKGGALSQMVVSNGYVVAAGSSPGGGQALSVRRLANGALAWYRLTQECAPDTVLVVDQLVMSDRCNNQTLAVRLAASRLATGGVVWSLPGVWQLQRGDRSGTAGHHLYATDPSGAVVDLAPPTGKIQHTLARATAVLAVDNSRAYADCGSLGVCGYSTTTGRRQWSALPGSAPTLAAEAGGVLYLDQGQALNAGTGRTIVAVWTGQATAIAVGDGRIAVTVATDPRVLDLFGLPGS